jgi:hypothetical protein
MGIAWLDADASPPMDAPVLRTGGLPLLGKAQEWPECARCEVPMLFRAQIPLGITSLASPADDRLMLVFECHAETEYGPCDAGTVLLSTGDRGPREAPLLRQFDVVIDHLGEDPQSACCSFALRLATARALGGLRLLYRGSSRVACPRRSPTKRSARCLPRGPKPRSIPLRRWYCRRLMGACSSPSTTGSPACRRQPSRLFKAWCGCWS